MHLLLPPETHFQQPFATTDTTTTTSTATNAVAAATTTTSNSSSILQQINMPSHQQKPLTSYTTTTIHTY